VDAGEIPGDDGIEGSHNSELAAVLLGKIAKSKQFNFHKRSVCE
jgi:hypothetical protein